MSNNTFTVVFADETELSGLTYNEAEEAMAESEKTDNRWTRVLVDNSD
jgi:hypothetical protein